jgi:hypothetical protein
MTVLSFALIAVIIQLIYCDVFDNICEVSYRQTLQK